MNSDGTDVRRLSRDPADDVSPAWSQDVTKITFVRGREGNEQEIYVMNADGSGVRRLTDDLAQDVVPVWSTASGAS